MRQRILLAAAIACTCDLIGLTLAAAATHRVQFGADGSFSPAVVTIRSGDTVEWTFAARTQSVVSASAPASAPNVCPVPSAFPREGEAGFAGPMPFAPSGVFSLAPLEDRGLRVGTGACPGGRGMTVNGATICATGPALTTMEDTWADPNTTGVFIRLLWNGLQTAPGVADSDFDFTDLDREVTQAVRHGKVYSLAIKAGAEGTPDWIFSTEANGRPRPGNGGGVTRLQLQDAGSSPDRNAACGPRMTLGSPTDPAFQKLYFDMLTKVAAHLRSRADWYRALAYIKPSGANLFSHENRLPKRCSPGCICNTQVFAEHGYTPSRLYDFYRKQFALLKKEFPGKAISYQLIQDGFPAINDSGGYERADGSSSNGRPLPQGTEQTDRILEIGQNDLGPLFVVQHNGLQVYRGDCEEPAGRRGGRAGRAGAATRGLGCPNPWVLRAGADGKTITGFQTQNLSDITTPEQVDLALKNAWVNSEASFVELYEGPLWVAVHMNNGILPSRKTIGQWADDFHGRRRKEFASMGDPFPKTYSHTFSGVAPGTVTYFEPVSCRVGTIQIGR
jgi:hypothetical protein